MSALDANMLNWSKEDVSAWLNSLEYDSYVQAFNKHEINGRALVMLDEDDLKQMIRNIGDRKNIYFHIKSMSNEPLQRDARPMFNRQHSANNNDSIHKISGHVCENCLNRFQSRNSDGSVANFENNIKSENFKTFVSVLYCCFASLWTAFILTVVHDRVSTLHRLLSEFNSCVLTKVPDMQKYPPLPDLILGL
jgi:hypothetical protein